MCVRPVPHLSAAGDDGTVIVLKEVDLWRQHLWRQHLGRRFTVKLSDTGARHHTLKVLVDWVLVLLSQLQIAQTHNPS